MAKKEKKKQKIDYRYNEIDKKYIKWLNKLNKYFADYHKHEVYGLENIPKDEPCIIAGNHSLATYDLGILQYKIYKEIGRYPRGLADRAFFYIPTIGKITGKMGGVPGDPKVAEYLLTEKKEMVLVAPGGMREALRPSEEKYKIQWETRKGFIKLSIRTGAPIVLAACPHADDLYEVTESKLTKFIYNKFRLPLPSIKGERNLRKFKPKKIKLEHHLSKPFYPPKVDLEDKEAFKSATKEMHEKVVEEMNRMMAKRNLV